MLKGFQKGAIFKGFLETRFFMVLTISFKKEGLTEENVIRMEREKMRYFMLMRSRIFE